MLNALILAAAVLKGLLAGASLDQSIKQVPSRNRIGVRNYAVYARGADLGPGVYWYAILSNAAVLASIAAAWLGWVQASGRLLVPLQLGAVFSLAHTVATFRAAPTMFKTRKVSLDDEQTLRALFDRFERWQALRATLQVLTFALSLWSVVLVFAR